MTKSNILELLKGGDRRSIGLANEVAAAVSKKLTLFSALMKGWWSGDPLVRMRTADATEKITRKASFAWPIQKRITSFDGRG